MLVNLEAATNGDLDAIVLSYGGVAGFDPELPAVLVAEIPPKEWKEALQAIQLVVGDDVLVIADSRAARSAAGAELVSWRGFDDHAVEAAFSRLRAALDAAIARGAVPKGDGQP